MNHLLTLTLAACSLLLTFSIFVCLLRLRRGPTIMDRILAFDTICVLLVGFMTVVSVRWDTALYLDLILVFTLLGFFSTVAFSLWPPANIVIWFGIRSRTRYRRFRLLVSDVRTARFR